MSGPRGVRSWPLAALLLLWGSAFTLACRLGSGTAEGMAAADSAADRVLGASRAAFSDTFSQTADNFFHMGVPAIRPQAFSNTLFQRLGVVLHPTKHEHVSGYQVGEIMPWLRLALDADPHNVDNYMVTAYWLNTAIRRPDLAEALLLEGTRNNPMDYKLINERAKLMMKSGGDDAHAALLLDGGLKLWPSGRDPKDRGSILDLAQMLSYRAFLYEMNGDPTKALALFRRALELSPGNGALAHRVLALEQGHVQADRDRKVFEQLFGTRHVCAREGHEDGDEHDDHDHKDGE